MKFFFVSESHFSFSKESESSQNLDWVQAARKKLKTEELQQNKDKTEVEIKLKKLKNLKEEGISLAERDCPWQAISKWDEALNLKIKGEFIFNFL